MFPFRLKLPVLFLLLALGCSGTGDEPTAPGVEVRGQSLPAAGAAYHGATPHLFLGGSAALVCDSHGGFSSSVLPPTAPGITVTADYVATFRGQLALTPPLTSSTVTTPLNVPVRMVERITLVSNQGALRTFETELVAFELDGSTLPGAAIVRESPTRASMGRTVITGLSDGRYRIESYYDVWLEISLDRSRSWHPAEGVVRMTLGPAAP